MISQVLLDFVSIIVGSPVAGESAPDVGFAQPAKIKHKSNKLVFMY
jgi:hypothetical protein